MRRSTKVCGLCAWLTASAVASCGLDPEIPESVPPGTPEAQPDTTQAMPLPSGAAGGPAGAVAGPHPSGSSTTEAQPELAPPQPTRPIRLADEYYGPVVSPAAIAPECQGFALDGLRYSPGGNLLPNRCAPFHPTTNNPYAVRCVDAWGHYRTGFAGDEYCILPPPPGKGIQIGAHPQGPSWFEQVSSGDLGGYENPAEPWVLLPGEEETVDYTTSAGNDADAKYYRAYHRVRPGQHHGVISTHDDPGAALEVWNDAALLPGSVNPFKGPVLTGVAGSLRPDMNATVSLEKPPEDAGLFYVLPAGAVIIFNMHHINFTTDPLLKEAWSNLWWEEDATTPILVFYGVPPSQALLAIEPEQTADIHYVWRLPGPMRVVNLFGHRHVWTPTFTTWIERRGKTGPELLYQSFDWSDVPTYRYDSLAQNPAPNPAARTDGGASGVVELQRGDELHYNCHVTFTDARAAEIGSQRSPVEIGPLLFANEAYDAEMCILSGTAVGTQLEDPEIGSTELPDFATID